MCIGRNKRGKLAGELAALRWEDIDLDVGRITIRRAFIQKTGHFRDYPKGGKQHSHSLPLEMLEKLKAARRGSDPGLVVKLLKGRYCRELELPVIGTHGLRQSISELYIHHGATRDELRRLFAHFAPSLTDRYVHDRGTNLEKVATVIRLFPAGTDPKMTPIYSAGKLRHHS